MLNRQKTLACVLLAVLLATLSLPWMTAQGAATPSNAGDSARVILQQYADAWKGHQELTVDGALVLAFWVRGGLGGTYNLTPSQMPGTTIREGSPAQYDIGFEVDIEFLRRLDRGEMGALTAMGQARSTDPIPLNPKLGELFSARPDASLLFQRVAFHFWNRDWPEIVPFGEGAARQVHGGNAAVLVYDQEFRSAWYQLKPGMHINADPGDQSNDFPQLIVVTRGRVNALLDGRERVASEGQAIFIPAGMAHEFWAAAGQYGELVWTAFGKGA